MLRLLIFVELRVNFLQSINSVLIQIHQQCGTSNVALVYAREKSTYELTKKKSDFDIDKHSEL